MKSYETINEEVFEMNKTKEINFSNSEIMYYLEEMISVGMVEDYELEAHQDIKQYGKVKKSALKKIKRNMFKLYNEKF
ncbi:hypothetical protein [Lysinibacillus sp. BPa_S21]|uniref:hypothetical protein n=1 Tax=Lysinibacillus sp. BPa_S21 TaxID=2932478 RepID=UPI0020130B29|nr:hypothetical protein [Lysinibacillus sp. BPa_S21]MCL1696280.1 hypothetical protein [Lysinibacillus sp. BPa_S21]